MDWLYTVKCIIVVLLLTNEKTFACNRISRVPKPKDLLHEFVEDERYANTSLHNRTVSCFLSAKSACRNQFVAYKEDDFNSTLCTDLIFTDVANFSTGLLKLEDPCDNLEGTNLLVNLTKKRHHGHYNIYLSMEVGQNPEGFYAIALDLNRTVVFIHSVARLLSELNMDGLDIHFRGLSSPFHEKGHLIYDFFEIMKRKFDFMNLEISLSIYPHKLLYEKTINANQLGYIDRVHIIPILEDLQHPLPPQHVATYEFMKTQISHYANRGFDRTMVLLGIISAGRAFILPPNVTENSTDFGNLSLNNEFSGSLFNVDGYLTFNEVSRVLNIREGWAIYEDKDPIDKKARYMQKGKVWISFETIKSIRDKAEIVKAEYLMGAAIWSLDTDDYYGFNGVNYPLLRSLHFALRK